MRAAIFLSIIFLQFSVMADDSYYENKRRMEFNRRVRDFQLRQVVNERDPMETYRLEMEMRRRYKREGVMPEESSYTTYEE